MKIKVFTLVLVLCMVVGLVPVAEAVTGRWSDKWGRSVSWDYADGVLTLTGEGEMPYGVTPWAELAVTELVVGSGIENVSDGAFRDSGELEKIKLADTVRWIGAGAFENCTVLREVELSAGLDYIDSMAFRDCAALTAVEFPENLMEIGAEAFYGCDLREVYLPANLLFVEYGQVFGGNENLTRFVVDARNTDLAADSQGALYNKGMTRLLDVPDGYTGAYTLPAGVRDFDEGDMFRHCAGLEAIHVEPGNRRYHSAEGVLFAAEYDYVYDEALDRYVPGEKISEELVCYPPAKKDSAYVIAWGVTDVDAHAFNNCRYLTEVTFPLTCMAEESAFYPGALSGRFSGCTSLEAVWFEGAHPVYVSDGAGVVFNRVEFHDSDAGASFGAGEALLLLPAGRIGYYAVPEGVRYLAERSIRDSRMSAIRFPSTLEVYGDGAMDYGHVAWMLFTGEKPREAAFAGGRSWSHVTATVFYPGWLESWQEPELNVSAPGLSYMAYEAGQEPVWEGNPFADVPAGSWYEGPVLWAVAGGITKGLSDDSFGPVAECNRAQVVTFLWRAAGCPEPERTGHGFADVQTGSFYEKAVLWAVENGITTGSDDSHFDPNGACNRAQVVTFLYRAFGSPAVAVEGLPFTDVPAGVWYEAPIAWAVENGITNGVSATAFGPNTVCNRAQVVTFLYRAYVD